MTIMKNYKVCWLSAGISSFIAGYLVKETVDEWIYIDVADQHPDSKRFIKDCEKLLDKPIKILKSSKYEDVEDVCRKRGIINTPHGAACTGALKKAVRKEWENSFAKEHGHMNLTYVWGFDISETRRADNMLLNFPEFNHEFPLIDRNITKADAHTLASSLGLKRPLLYDLGFPNNNCVGCVKAGMYTWNLVRKHFPEVFEKRAKMERELGHSCINGIFLDELDPNAGRPNEVEPECSIFCYLASQQIEEETVFLRRNGHDAKTVSCVASKPAV